MNKKWLCSFRDNISVILGGRGGGGFGVKPQGKKIKFDD